MKPSETLTKSSTSQSTQSRRLTLFVSLAVIAGLGLAWFLEQSGVQTFPGLLEARTTTVTTTRPVRVQNLSVATGQAVVPGDPLIQLIDTQLEEQFVSKQREIAELEFEVIRSKATAEVELAWRRRELQAEIFETQLKVAALSQERLNKQVEQIAWKERLSNFDANNGSLTAEVDHPFRAISLDLQRPDDRRLQAMLHEDAAAASAEALATQIALCEQRLKNLELLGKEIEVKLRASSGVDVAEARLQGARQDLSALETRVKDLTMISPTYGTVGEVKLQSGDRVSSGGKLIDILDNSQPHVVAQIPSGIASKISSGSKVTLVFPTNEQRIGIVATIPPQTTTVAGATESYVAVKIEPAGKLWPKIAVGSNVKVQLR